LLIVFLAACAQRTPTAAPALTATTAAANTATAAILAPTATLPDPHTPTPVPPSPTPTPPPITIGYITTGAGTPGVLAAVEAAAQSNGWVLSQAADPTGDGLRALVAQGVAVLVADGPEFEAVAHETAAANPALYVIGVGHSGAEVELPNLLALGGPLSREDQLGFMAGVVTGYLTEGRVVTAIANPATSLGLKYRNGFLHGVRYACSRCRVDFIDLADENATAFAAERAALNAQLSSDVVFAATWPAGEAGLKAAAGVGAWVVGAGGDLYVTAFENGAAPGADRVVTSAYFEAGAAVQAALAGYATGAPLSGVQPLSAANGAVALAPYRVSEDVLSELDRQEIAAVLSRLADGSLDTGINPLTGDEL
jgi:basic membrane lipoprotein Med (substrate-binding protein (PBP1-ABC) superfamily)